MTCQSEPYRRKFEFVLDNGHHDPHSSISEILDRRTIANSLEASMGAEGGRYLRRKTER